MINLLNENKCVGCSLCQALCPNDSIKMQEGSEHFLFPKINENTCLNCEICLKNCIINKKIPTRNMNETSVYAARNKSKEELLRGSSGSIFYILAKKVINSGGAVIGAAFDKDLQLKHIVCDNIEELSTLCKSKYIQSKIGKNIYDYLILNKTKEIMFVGTPCQIAAIDTFIKVRKLNRERFFLVDFICHGVPNQWFFNKMLEHEHEKKKSKVTDFIFRYKYNINSSNRRYRIQYDNSKQKIESYYFNGYYRAFYSYDCYRKSCYNCKFASVNRISDLTLGDFWGINKTHKNFFKNNVSCIVVNSKIGQKMMEITKDDIYLIDASLKDIIDYNSMFSHSNDEMKRNRFIYKDIETYGYMDIVNKYYPLRFDLIIKEKIKNILKR